MKDIKIWLEAFLHKSNVSEVMIPYLSFLAMLLLTAGLIAISVYALRILLKNTVARFVKRTTNKWDDLLIKHKFLNAISLFIGIAVIQAAVPILFEASPKMLVFVGKLIDVFILFVILKVINTILKATEETLLATHLYRDKPIASYFQMVRIVLIIMGVILGLSILLSKSPLYFFGAFGAISAVLLLIFKDTILGLVASVQISTNDIVRIGDWIEMTKYNADGEVNSINLNTVKVKNWDNTITSIPTYYFVNEGFKNYRGMQDSGGRRIMRTLRVSIGSIKFVDKEFRNKLQGIHLMHDYIIEKQDEINQHNIESDIDTSILLNGRRLTNVGLFRMYITNYLRQHPGVHKGMTIVARQKTPDEFGVPLEVYCFANSVGMVDYEGTQSDIFDHLFAAAPFFDIELYQRPSGKDFQGINQK